MEVGIQWPLVLFTVIAGAGYGAMATAGVARLANRQNEATRKTALIVVLALLVVGGLMSVFHLAHPERFMGAIANLLSFSGIALELISLAVGVVVAFLFLVFASTGNKAGEKVMAACSIAVGVVAAFLQGYAYFEVAAQPGWHSLALTFGYLFTSLAAGALIYVAVAAFRKDDEAALRLTGILAVALAALAALSCIAYAASLGAAGLLANAALVVAVLTVVCELAAAGLGTWFAFKKRSLPLVVAAAVAALAASIAVRALMWVVASYGFNFIWEAAANRGLLLF
ncbi:DmsC/YnfH family molybdoenzyme membrane anchor subunit [Arabiibacter massiliensis]|uniref:DmsC/YnfH family molybdoenzyme membrane anchor subunit n=1 Tax=Arabiibacter massiliensis TaxID=1870985 RepID=UPI0009BB19E7|nr:DmsC/YnfH family molybdoenzyme membrane anchor subunit [Arabiibacter massiliensis]